MDNETEKEIALAAASELEKVMLDLEAGKITMSEALAAAYSKGGRAALALMRPVGE